MKRSLWAPFILVAAGSMLASCSPLHPQSTAAQPRGEGRVISGEEVRASGAANAWEALRRGGIHLRMAETASGRPVSLTPRGRTSLVLSQIPIVMVDGVRIVDFRSLYDIPGTLISEIEILGGVAGTRRFGTGGGNGVIIVTTSTIPR